MEPKARRDATNYLSGDVIGTVIQAHSIYGGVNIYVISNESTQDSAASLPNGRSLGTAVAPVGIAGNGPGKYGARMHPADSLVSRAVRDEWVVVS